MYILVYTPRFFYEIFINLNISPYPSVRYNSMCVIMMIIAWLSSRQTLGHRGKVVPIFSSWGYGINTSATVTFGCSLVRPYKWPLRTNLNRSDIQNIKGTVIIVLKGLPAVCKRSRGSPWTYMRFRFIKIHGPYMQLKVS